ncbi:MAG TPA: prolyl oligopeptidase family serine peptidase [Puia sp.]|nr:prolyl oligopeptidase family serine peptidase [Puia sp.]
MHKLFLFLIFIGSMFTLPAQNPAIDSSAYDKWPKVDRPAICNNGNYALYTIENQPAGSRTFVVLATYGNWKMEIPDVASYPGCFTQDSRTVVFTKPKDSLGIVTLGTSYIEYISHVSSFKLPKKGNSKWLAYLSNTPAKELVVRDLTTGKQKYFTSVLDYLLNDDGRILLLLTDVKEDSAVTVALQWVDLSDGKVATIWSGIKAVGFTFDITDTQLAFSGTEKKDGLPVHALWYYQDGMDKAVLLANDQSPGVDSGLKFDQGSIQGFSIDGSRLFLKLKETDLPQPKAGAVKVDIWNYTDARLQSQQLYERAPRSFTVVINISDHRIIRLEQKDDIVQSLFQLSNEKKDNFILLSNTKGDINECNWNPTAQSFVYLVSTKDGERARLNKWFCSLSPGGNFVIYYDPTKKNYFSYATLSGITRNITQTIPTVWTEYGNDQPDAPYAVNALDGWLKDDAAVLLHDQNDIWVVDPVGNKLPINLTNGYGRRHNIVFRLGLRDYSYNAIANNEKLILTAFNYGNKENGFYSKVLGQIGDPLLLTMGAYVYYAPGNNPGLPGLSPLKSHDAEIYLIQRMSATESPNYFCTADFKTFIRLSNIHPETTYNWLTSELLTWKTFNGSISQGVIYKPENFDPKKKYPIIFNYYDKLSDELNVYHIPGPSMGNINVPWFVSRGYLVFTPDIHYKIGETGESVVNAVVSAADYLSKMPWVDGKKMGINGHSFGGYETNYLVTHTHLFAAACSASGVSDLISSYGSLWPDGSSQQEYSELRRLRMGTTLWQRPDLYIKNSPIFLASNVTTPLLMMNNKGDGAVQFAQGVEFFTALRRLRKKVWMLQYDGEGHEVFDRSANDYSIRLAQFFDHYLRGSAAPKWMTEGVRASRKGIDTGLQLDTSGRIP